SGTPKGVVVEQRSVLNLVHGLELAIYERQSLPLRVGINGSLAFDTSVKQIFQVLRGATVDLVPDEVRIDGPAFIEYVRRHKIDVVDCTPSQCQPLLDAGLVDAAATVPKVLLLGGEPIGRRLWDTLCASRGPRSYNLYGPTECTVDATVCPVTREL